MYLLQLFDFYGASGFTLLWTATWQCIGVAWVYGDEKFYDALEAMVGKRPGPYFKICWKYLAPILNTVSKKMSRLISNLNQNIYKVF